MSERTRKIILLSCIVLLTFLSISCTLDIDRSGWGWDGSKGNPPNVERYESAPTPTPSPVPMW